MPCAPDACKRAPGSRLGARAHLYGVGVDVRLAIS